MSTSTESPTYPPRAWRPVAAILLGLLSGVGFVFIWRASADLLPREYLLDYIRLSLPDPHLPAFLPKKWTPTSWRTYDEILNGSILALPSDSGTFTLRKFVPKDRNAFQAWIKKDIYEGKPLYRVLLWPEIATLLTMILLIRWAIRSHNAINQEARNGRVLRGPRLIGHWRWNWATSKRNRGFWIETR